MKWPQRIIDELGREPQVGDWFAECCIEDFQQLTPESLAELLELYDDEDSGGMFWRAEDGDAARAELLAEATPDASSARGERS
jgi:hypothetical protein